jgi:8-oxo-dGTP pyrophosphatase MutT (NUDIX family)
MKNFPIIDKETGREYWISRSVAVLGIVTATDYNGVEHILAVQRGIGTPDPEFVGAWCLPCGYLDFDETCKEAVSREVKEETGIDISPDKFELVYINDDPKSDKRQNITLRFKAELIEYANDVKLTDKFSETNEVMDIKWIPIDWVDNYKWAFNHEKIIKGLYY